MSLLWLRACFHVALVLLLASRRFTAAEQGADNLVQVDFYGEALCPYCARFFKTVAEPLLLSDTASLFNFSYVAYGNAHTTPEGVQCQHGELECTLNRVINCAVHFNPGSERWGAFVGCLESDFAPDSNSDRNSRPAECAAKAKLDWKVISDCVKGPLGNELVAAAAAQTAALIPAHKYVPWVVVNGIPLLDDYENLRTYICAAFQGDRPDSCFNLTAGGTDAVDLHTSTLDQLARQ